MKASKKVKRYYAVMGIYTKGTTCFKDMFGDPFVLSATSENKEAGIVGIIPVFTNKRKAQRFAGKHEIVEIEEVI